ncbi:protein-transmembrane prediction [Algibacter amylolyticus]|uniref:protein-transmembrane prediction n=1 Tax=Algibacter amylolyticus TaxID=1608400 RepID=UPI001621860E|nr:protein-transmembrane prediction [Algibacter amylolyticus]MBB5268674.1 hypothetical protein [Algibacter amylolyticus]
MKSTILFIIVLPALLFVSFQDIYQMKRVEIQVSNLAELKDAVKSGNQNILMKPGNYIITELPEDERSIVCSGSNNTINLKDVYINFPVGTCKDAHFNFTGSNNKLSGGVFEDTYQNGMTKVTDFGSYNQNRKTLAKGLKGGANIRVSGNGNTIEGVKLTVRGSFPYGYGNMYGIGRGNATGLDKRCALLITGVGNTVDNCEFQHRAFGHVIYMQKNADKTLIKNSYIEGAVRPSNDTYKETNDGDLPKRFDYKMPLGQMKGLPIPRDVMFNLTEDGIRAYNIPGSVTVENCKVVKCRGGIKLYMAKGDVKVSNSTVLDCVVEGYSLNNGGELINCKGNAAYGPLLYMHFDKVSNQKIDLTVLPAPHAVGNHVFAAIKGRGHNITLKRANYKGQIDNTLRPIVVGYKARFEFLTTSYPGVPEGYGGNFNEYFGDKTYQASNISIRNETEYPVIIGDMSKNNSIESFGNITNLGENNTIEKILRKN